MPTKRDAGDTSTNFSDNEMEGDEERKNLYEEIFNVPPGIYPELDGHYILHQTIGSGGSSKVKIATDVVNGDKVAVKIIEKAGKEVEMHRIAREISTLLTIKHPHICKLLRVIHSETAILLIMEYCPMDLHDFIRNTKLCLSEKEARRIFIQLMSAVAYLHDNGIAHRDLKPENVLMDFNNNVKLTDFGLCAVTSKTSIHKSLLKTPCGSPAYCAPELLRGLKYIGSKLDVWSLGVILYVLLCSQLPFHSKQMKELYRKIQEVEYTIPDWVPTGPRDLIEKILQGNVSLRPSLYQLWFHPWILESGEGFLEAYQHQMASAEKAIKEEKSARDGNLVGEVPRSRSRSRSPYPYRTTVVNFIDDLTPTPDLEMIHSPVKKPEKSRFTVTLVSPDTLDNNIRSDSVNNNNKDAGPEGKADLNADESCQDESSTSVYSPCSTDGGSTKSKLSKIFSGLRKLTRICMLRRQSGSGGRDCSSGSSSSMNEIHELRELKLSSINKDIKMTSLTIVDGEFADCILDKLQEGLQDMGISSERMGSTVRNGITSPCKFEFEVMSLEGLNRFCVQRKYIRSKDPAIIKNIIQYVLLMAPKA